jgi:catechol 2,3-dioxygenase-like lactoylglutathione lyase family enzyme
MLHHISFGTSDLDRARAFYDPIMREVGLRRTLDVADAVGYGAGITVFSLNVPTDGKAATPGNGVHVAFEVEKRAAVDAFWRVALAQGAISDGEPALRPHYDRHYYAAFVRDPDGNKVEALTFAAHVRWIDPAAAMMNRRRSRTGNSR